MKDRHPHTHLSCGGFFFFARTSTDLCSFANIHLLTSTTSLKLNETFKQPYLEVFFVSLAAQQLASVFGRDAKQMSLDGRGENKNVCHQNVFL